MWMLATGFFLAVSAVWIVGFTTAHFHDTRDSYDYAQIGRQIRSGEGYTTLQIFPRHIPWLKEKGHLDTLRWPSLLRYPATPTANALFQLFMPDPVRASVAQSGFWFLLSVPVLFLLAARVGDPWVAVIATLLYAGDPRIWRSSATGMTESLAILLTLGFFLLALGPTVRQGRTTGWLALGVLCGLAYLTRTQLALVLLPPALLVLATGVESERRLPAAVAGSVGLAATVAPWLIRNLVVAGQPVFSFLNTRVLMALTPSYANADLVLEAPVGLPAVLEQHGSEIALKVSANLWPNAVEPSFWAHVLGGYAVALPILALVLVFKRWPGSASSSRLFERAVLTMLCVNFLVASLNFQIPRFYDMLIPLLILIIVHRISALVAYAAGRFAPGARLMQAVGLVVVLVLLGRAAAITASGPADPPSDDAAARDHEILRRIVEPRAVVASDVSERVALYNGNPSIRLPWHGSALLTIDEEYLPIDYVLISMQARYPRKFPRRESSPERKVALRSERPLPYGKFVETAPFRERYRLVTELPSGAVLYRRRGETSSGTPPTRRGWS